MSLPSRFIVSGKEYTLALAELEGILADPAWCDTYNEGQGKWLRWIMRIEANEQEIDDDNDPTDKEFGDDAQSPIVELDGLTFPNLASWQDLIGTSLSWSRPINEQTGEGYGWIHYLDSQPITSGTLEITGRTGAEFRVLARGEGDLEFDFAVDATVRFTGIRVRGSGQDNENSLRNRLSEQLSPANLRAGELVSSDPFNTGETLVETLFTPVE